MNRSRTSAVGVAALTALVLSGCSAGGSTGAAGASGGAMSQLGSGAVEGAPMEPKGPATAPPKAGAGAAFDPAALGGRRQVRSADLSVQVSDVAGSAARVRSLATGAQGYVAQEQTGTVPPQPVPLEGPTPGRPSTLPQAQSTLTLRVPEVALDRVMDQVAALGTVVSRGQSTKDVTSQYVDTASRLKSQRASVDRVRTLLGKATNLGQVVQIESELSRRQADLESLEAQLAALNDQTTLATLNVNLAPRPTTPVTAPPQGAFLTGLLGGWKALVASVGVALTIVGAVLPFAVLAAVVLWPVLLVLRRRRTRPAAT